MERPLSMTENEKVRASLPRGRRRTHASSDARPKAHGCRQQLRGNLNQMRLTGKCRTAPPVEARRVSVLKTTVTDINRSSQLGLSDRGVLLYIHSRMDVKVRYFSCGAGTRKKASPNSSGQTDCHRAYLKKLGKTRNQ